MRRQRPSASACNLSRTCYCRAWRRLWAVAAGALVLAPATACASRYRGRAWHTSAAHGTADHDSASSNGHCAFVHPSAAVWNRFKYRTWDEALAGSSRSNGRTGGARGDDRGVRWAHGTPAPLQSVEAIGTNSSSDSAGEIQSVEGEKVHVILTAAGGRPHSLESRQKISAANKGKKPWNVGVAHSEETRRKIANGAREAARKRKESLAQSMVSLRSLCLPGDGGSPHQ